jgi:hypothetical protein
MRGSIASGVPGIVFALVEAAEVRMDRNVWVAMSLAAALVAGISADDEKTITVTGCVQNFSAKGTVGTTERGYLLTNVTRPDAVAPAQTQGATPAGTPTATSGTAAPGMPASGTSGQSATDGARPSESRANSSYKLEGQESELKHHVGHKVEVKGALEPRQGDEPKGEESRLQVSSIRMLSSKCSSR